MVKREDSRKLKLSVLARVKEKKNILFGAFSNNLTKELKMREWEKISEYAKSIGVIPPNKSWTYLRDVWWPNIRKSTTEKLDNSRTTGSSGGRGKLLSEVDTEVWEIIGKDSPVVTGLPVEESLGQLDSGHAVPTSPTPSTSCNVQRKFSEEADLPSSFPQPQHSQANKSSVLDKKRDLQVELLKYQIYLTKLKCRKLELEMNLSESDFTSDLVTQATHDDPVVLIVED